MPSNGVTVSSPLKGVDKNANYTDHDIEYALDASNVLPFDRLGRARVNQRPGTSKVYASQIGSGNPVMCLAQTSIPLDPTAILPATLSADDEMTYTPGGTLSVASGGLWHTTSYTNYGISTGGEAFSISVNGTNSTPGIPGQTSMGMYQTNIALGTNYLLRASFDLEPTSTTNDTIGCGLYLRCDRTGFTTTKGWSVWFNRNNIQVKRHLDNDPTVNFAKYTFPSNLSAGYHTCEVQVSGEKLTIRVDGITQTTVTMDGTDSTQNGIGFGMRADPSFPPATDWWRLYTGGPATKSNLRQNNVLAVSNGNIYYGDETALAVATGGTGVLSTTVRPQFTYAAGKGWFVDGVSIQQIDIASGSMDTYSADAGTAPTGCTLTTVYRGRLVLAGSYAFPHLFYFSRVGDQKDWDYSQLDSAAAFAGSASTAGRIGDPITALMPASDDVMYIGGDHTLHAIRGDPADGGSIDLVSDAIGVLGPNAWAKAPDGTIYFVGTGGLFSMTGNTPVNMSSGRWNEFFRSIDRTANFIELEWDVDRHGLWIFITPVATGAATHLFWDSRAGGFWPVQFPNAHGPLSAMVFRGDGPNDRILMLGTRNGYVQGIHEADKDDDGTAVVSFVQIGPLSDNVESESTAEWFDIILGEPAAGYTDADFNVTVNVQTGPTAERALYNPLRNLSKTYSGSSRRQVRWRQRVRGAFFVFTLTNNVLSKTWSFEKAVAMMMPSGIVRRYK